jgi:uncharacterized protein YjeT (DUF2065 family)
MTRLLLWLFPRAWRASYGREVGEMLAGSQRPWRDRADLLRAAAAVRGRQLVDTLLERTDTTMRNLRAAGIGLVAVGLAGVAWVIPQLADGIIELPFHWWSSLAALPLVAGTALLAAAWWLGNGHGGRVTRR